MKDFGRKVQHLSKETCTYDKTFDWTDEMNTELLTNLWKRDYMVIFDSFTFDFGVYTLLYLFGMGIFTSMSTFVALLVNSVG